MSHAKNVSAVVESILEGNDVDDIICEHYGHVSNRSSILRENRRHMDEEYGGSFQKKYRNTSPRDPRQTRSIPSDNPSPYPRNSGLSWRSSVAERMRKGEEELEERGGYGGPHPNSLFKNYSYKYGGVGYGPTESDNYEECDDDYMDEDLEEGDVDENDLDEAALEELKVRRVSRLAMEKGSRKRLLGMSSSARSAAARKAARTRERRGGIRRRKPRKFQTMYK